MNTRIRSAEDVICFKKRAKTPKPWLMSEIINKMEEGRKWRNISSEEFGRRYSELRMID